MTIQRQSITAGIISWDGMRDATLAIARAIHADVDDLVVIYSNAANVAETGPGRWIQLPQSDFFGKKFACLLDHLSEGHVLLLVQADAHCDDWPGLVKRYRALIDQRPETGLWSPDIDYTPFPNSLVMVGRESGDIFRVLQTDGIVLGIHPDVTTRLAQFSYVDNNLGWGIDWAAIGFCMANGLPILRDRGVFVIHPRSQGYDGTAARSQMHQFLTQLNAGEMAAVHACRKHIDLHTIYLNHLGHIPMSIEDKSGSNYKAPWDLVDHVDFLMIQSGRLLLTPKDPAKKWIVRYNGNEKPATTLRPAARLPRLLAFDADCGDDAHAEPSDPEWSCPGQPTMRYVFWKNGPLRIPLLKSCMIDATLYDVCLRMGAAVHRADASLLFEWHDVGDDTARTEQWVKLDRLFNGAADIGSYQKIEVRIPDTGDDRILTVSLCYWNENQNPKEPNVVFCTRPYLRSTADTESATSPQLLMAPDAPAGCAPTLQFAIEPTTEDVILSAGTDEYQLLSSPGCDARFLLEDRTLRAEADFPIACTLYVNGRALRPVWVGPEPAEIFIGAKLLATPSTLVELRDPTGNLVYASFHPQEEFGTIEDKLRHPDAWRIEEQFDSEFYLAGFAAEEKPGDPVSHYLAEGWQQGRDPAPWFSTRHYLAMHPDVATAGINPFLHYCTSGQAEGRQLARLGQSGSGDVFHAHAYAVSAGPHFEEFDPNIGAGRRKRAKVLAYYLPQFHAVPVNDKNWGQGFTEWRNLPRGMPRFEGHIQPRIPRDLGCYDLAESDVMRRQIAMAKAAGLHGFCFYHYWFDGKRVLETPIERLLADPSLDFPFCLMWANENWTKTWDGAETDVILKQSYRDEDTIPFIDDLARHMKDPRYIRIDNRPLFFIYRPGHIPEAKDVITRWRQIFQERHDLAPLIFNAQAFGDNDPRAFGLDGAIEFPPHKVLSGSPDISSKFRLFNKEFTGNIRDYTTLVEYAMSEAAPEFPVIRTVLPSWDNEARRPGRSTILAHSTPEKFAKWMEWAVSFSQKNQTHGESFVCVNAWNEWAEGAYLEPDVHFGAAYLNALSRVVHGMLPARQVGARSKILLVGHDVLAFGAQRILAHIGEALQRQLGVEVTFLILDSNRHGGLFETLIKPMRRIGKVLLADQADFDTGDMLKNLAAQGYQHAITNTTIVGEILPDLKKEGFEVISLVHELPTILSERRLEKQAGNIAKLSDHVIFPAEIVRKGFESFAGKVKHAAEIFPQGLYNIRTLEQTTDRVDVRKELELSVTTQIVLGVGFGDMRKGVDRFFAAALSLCARRSDLAFVWVGALSHDTGTWLQAEIDASGMGDRIRIMGHREDAARFYAAADVYYLSSREDPFPSVVLEALAAGLPVVGHQGCGGSDELIARHGTLVSGDSLAVMDAICAHLDQARNGDTPESQARRQEIEDNYRYDKYAFGLLQRLMPDLASVSAVVPNYNYAPYIGARLQSVFDQSYPLREVVVLDDASTDDSVEAITSAAAAAKRSIILQVNEKNSGSPFPQWFRGVSIARGDYVWIAEADDLATPEFVGQLVARMQASGAVLGFCDSRQMDEKDEPSGDSYKPYVNQIEAGAFDQAFDMDGPEFLARYLSVKNVILNVSGVVFRRDALLDAFRAVGDGLFDLRVAGDWRLYLELCRVPGHCVSYLPEPMNAHRRHKVSVTHALNVERHLGEIAAMQELAGQMAVLNPVQQRKQQEHLEACRIHLTGKES